MYCKYCGNTIASNCTKCASCGAKIDLNDGGQSFYEEHELDAWQFDNVMMKGPQTSMPKTDMRSASDVNIDLPRVHGNEIKQYRGQSSRRRSSQLRRKKKKTIFDYFNLSSSNKLIIFCISSALAIVLLVVAIIAVLNSSNENGEGESTQTYSEQVNDEPAKEVQNPQGDEKPEEKSEERHTDVEYNTGRVLLEDVKIIVGSSIVEHPVAMYKVNNVIYVSMDRVLKHEGYNWIQNMENTNRVCYVNEKQSCSIEIEKQSNLIWIKTSDDDVQMHRMDAENFNVDSDTYVPAESFFKILGYSEVEYNEQEKYLKVEK